MTAELTVLTLAALLQCVQLALMAVPANRELGLRRTMSPRDTGRFEADLSKIAARLYRAVTNHFEGLILFSIACLVVTLSGTSTGFTATCAWIYLVARIAYIPAYAFGLVPWRSLIWGVGLLATMAMLFAALF